ncbi:DUF2306 domain-containing protein [Stieleria sp. JC731]|uniref:DUF2306 domain-containing protein n=1 Tax=Pirellulaceae TaxID=2691357 RepID=UPI001E61B991|nr:DUF2306 domain-containing protein [Stieleria sp. JC731]MCC9600054.1 DUF2306 domain-containing protein [Stieleria sp. JC731]
MKLHLATVVPCIFLGLAVFCLRNGTVRHRTIGWVYSILMMVTSVITLLMPARAGSQVILHFGMLHTFSFVTIVSIPYAIYSVRTGNLRGHKITMISTYCGAIVVAGLFTLMPGRYLHGVFFGQ